MPEVRTTAAIRRPPAEVFDFVTTPGHWPRWHPSSLGVTGATDHPLDVGEQVVEEFRVAGQEGVVTWTVRERVAPRRWVIDARRPGREEVQATITYTLAPDAVGTSFERLLAFDAPPPGVAWSILGPIIERESAEAVRRLKSVLEGAE